MYEVWNMMDVQDFLSGLFARSLELQDRIERRSAHLLAKAEQRREALSEDYVEGLIIGGFLAALGGVGLGWIWWG